jgi:hypothetical protein
VGGLVGAGGDVGEPDGEELGSALTLGIPLGEELGTELGIPTAHELQKGPGGVLLKEGSTGIQDTLNTNM